MSTNFKNIEQVVETCVGLFPSFAKGQGRVPLPRTLSPKGRERERERERERKTCDDVTTS